MRIMLLCNAGLAIEYQNNILLVDVLNKENLPFSGISDEVWKRILHRQEPFDRVCGLFFTHNHSDHCDMDKVRCYQKKWPDIPCWIPGCDAGGVVRMGSFAIEFRQIDHAPMDEPLPAHVVSIIRAGGKTVYVAADAALDPKQHQAFLNGRVTDAAFWNSMYLSRTETRTLLNQTSARNYIYHMPEMDPDGFGIWKKCKNNFLRYPEELRNVRVLKRYPCILEI